MREYLGFGIIIIGLLTLIYSGGLFNFFDNSNYIYPILSENNNSTSFDFNFSQKLIHNYYTISDGRKIYANYLNIYLDNSTNYNVTEIDINNKKYDVYNSTHEYSIALHEDTLNSLNQNVSIIRNPQVNISRIELSYFGMNYNNQAFFQFMQYALSAIILIIGLGILLSSY